MNILKKSLIVATVVLGITACGKSKESTKIENNLIEKTITSEEIEKILDNQEYVIVDSRENDAYNGWAIDGIKRGGHLKRATDFSSAWLEKLRDNKDLSEEILKTKGITPDKKIVLYDTNGKDASEVALFLKDNGYENIEYFNFNTWVDDTSKELVQYKNYQMLVPASWVKDLIDGKNPENYNGTDFKIFEVSWGDEKDSPDYLKSGHIKGAIHINTDWVEEGPLWNRKSDKELIEFAKNMGITVDTTVVLYGADTMPASRVAVILKYLGVKDVRILNGGTQKWVQNGYELEKNSNKPTPVDSFGADVPLNKNYIIDLDDAKKVLADKNGRLVDIRSWKEYIGEISGYDYIKPKGRPAGAVWGHCGSSTSSLEDFRNPDNTMRNSKEILKMWKDFGISPENRLSFYCGTGWRAAEVLWYADVMGLENISLYDGGWNEWSGNTGNTPEAIEIGEPSIK